MSPGQQLFLQLVDLSSARWAFEQPHEWVALRILALVPSGRFCGLDRRFADRGRAAGRLAVVRPARGRDGVRT